MGSKESATFLANLLAKQKLEFSGAREAFQFTKAYEWLLEQAKPEYKESKSVNSKRKPN